MLVTLAGIITLCKFLHFANILCFNALTPELIVTFFRLLQSTNASFPIVPFFMLILISFI